MFRLTIVVLMILLAAPGARAQFTIPSFTIDCGGGTSAGGTFSLLGVIGQPDAGPTLSGGTFTLAGGFLAQPSTPTCPADLDDGSGTGTPDGGVTIDDLLYYLDIFAQGVTRADLDDGSGTGTPDGGVTIDDLLFYLFHFASGC